MNEEKYGYDDVEETEILEPFLDTNSIAPVAPPVAMAPEVITEPETEVLTEAEVQLEETTEALVEQPVETEVQMAGVDGTVQLNEVEIKPVSDFQVSNFKLFFTFLLMIVLGGTILFMPEISDFIRMKKEEEAEMLQPKITTGSLKCELERNSDNFDLKYEYQFMFTDNKFKKLYYISETKGDMNLDEAELEELNNQCLLLKESTANLTGVEVSCKLLSGTLTKTQTLDYEKIDVTQAYSAYSEAGGIYPEYKYLQDMDGIEKNMKAAGYTCKRIK